VVAKALLTMSDKGSAKIRMSGGGCDGVDTPKYKGRRDEYISREGQVPRSLSC
jgi:hypothetical protein